MSEGHDAAKRAGAGDNPWEGGSRIGRIGTILREKWKIDSRIGRGGMATVYAATHRNGNRVAIKMLHTEFSRDPSVRARFLREAYVANGIGHRGTVRVLDDDVAEDGAVFLVMDLLEGETLEARRIRCGGKLPLDEVLDVTDELLDLLAMAHERGVVHRDIKPENIFITERGEIKVLDFGIARLRDSTVVEQTSAGVMLGTPDFMSPEQARGDGSIDARTDLWSTGATIFTLLSGDAVHSGSTLREHLDLAATRPARSLRDVTTGVPDRIVMIVDRALSLDQKDRWSSARAMQQRLRAARGMPASVDDDDERESMTMLTPPMHMTEDNIPIAFDDTVLSTGRPESGPRSDEPTVMRALPPEIATNGSFLRPILRQHQLDDDDPTPFSEDHQPRFQPRFGVQRGGSTPPPAMPPSRPGMDSDTGIAEMPTRAKEVAVRTDDPRRVPTERHKILPNLPRPVTTTKAKLPPWPVVIAISAIGLCIIATIVLFILGR